MAAHEKMEDGDSLDKALKELYYNAEDPRSYGGVDKLLSSAQKAGVQNVKRAREKQFPCGSAELLRPQTGNKSLQTQPHILQMDRCSVARGSAGHAGS